MIKLIPRGVELRHQFEPLPPRKEWEPLPPLPRVRLEAGAITYISVRSLNPCMELSCPID